MDATEENRNLRTRWKPGRPDAVRKSADVGEARDLAKLAASAQPSSPRLRTTAGSVKPVAYVSSPSNRMR